MKTKMNTVAAAAVALAAGLLATATAASAAQGPLADVPASAQPKAGTPIIAGVWEMRQPPKALKTLDGKDPPLLPAAKAEYAKRQAAMKAGDKKADPISDCIMHGVPRLLYSPYPVAILQEDARISFVHEANHTFRIVPLNQALPEEPDPLWLGYSVGKWDGNTLVVDTVGLRDGTWLDYSGLPHSTDLKVQERYTLKGDTIDGQVTITDPKTYSAPWSTAFTLVKKPGYQLQESVCTYQNKM